MKCKVRLSYAVEMFVEGGSEEAIMDWLMNTTPQEARDLACQNGKFVVEDYEEEILAYVRDDSEIDYIIEEEE